MRSLVIYESMYGNTHSVADGIAEGLRSRGEVVLVPTYEATDELVASADLVVVGGPTHVHGMTRAKTRIGAREEAAKPGSVLTLDEDADGPGVRDWLGALAHAPDKAAAAFDTRIDAPAVLTGRASSGIANGLRDHGFRLVARPESFLVDRHNKLVAGEVDRARAWGSSLAGLVGTSV
jgi:Flavodoxin domain